MAANQGTINRYRGSISFPDFPELNIVPSSMGKEMITITFAGEVVHAIPTATGLVTSPEPYQMVEFSADVLRSIGIGDLFKKKIEKLGTMGDAVLRSDSTAMSDYNFFNTSIKSVDPVKQDGNSATMTVHFQGFYPINQDLYNV